MESGIRLTTETGSGIKILIVFGIRDQHFRKKCGISYEKIYRLTALNFRHCLSLSSNLLHQIHVITPSHVTMSRPLIGQHFRGSSSFGRVSVSGEFSGQFQTPTSMTKVNLSRLLTVCNSITTHAEPVLLCNRGWLSLCWNIFAL